ncbi:class I SAM-dependent methyltransferase [bacterium]|nr:class I SAM-dependent methyltransferase [bacterium]
MNQESYFVENLCQNKKCLEIAPGIGKFLSVDPSNRTGIEIDNSLCMSLEDNGLKCINADFFKFKVLSKFDILYSRNFIEHLNPDQLVDFLKKSADLLAPDGKLILITPVETVIWRTASHIRPYPPVSLYKLLNSKTENYIRKNQINLTVDNAYCTFKIKGFRIASRIAFLLFNWLNNGSVMSSSPPFASHYIIILSSTK